MSAEFTAICKGCDEPWPHADDNVYCPDCRPMFACEGPGESGNGCEEIGPLEYETHVDQAVTLRACESCHKAMTAWKNKAAAREEI